MNFFEAVGIGAAVLVLAAGVLGTLAVCLMYLYTHTRRGQGPIA